MEQYIAILKVLDGGESKTKKQIVRKAGLHVIPKEFFNFLVKLDLIQEVPSDSKTFYIITEKGQRICKYFGSDEDREIFGGLGIFRMD
jgi:predicted transcriptional regulator